MKEKERNVVIWAFIIILVLCIVINSFYYKPTLYTYTGEIFANYLSVGFLALIIWGAFFYLYHQYIKGE